MTDLRKHQTPARRLEGIISKLEARGMVDGFKHVAYKGCFPDRYVLVKTTGSVMVGLGNWTIDELEAKVDGLTNNLDEGVA